MVFFKNNPFIRLILPLIIGILLQYNFPIPSLIIFSISLILLIAIVLLVCITISYPLNYLKGLVLSLFLISIGLLTVCFTRIEKPTHTTNKHVLLIGEINEVPLERDNNYKAKINIEAQKSGPQWQEINTKIIAYFEKPDSSLNLKAGNKIVFNTRLNDVNHQQNPFGFDYAKYLALKQISQSVYLKTNDWMLLSEDEIGIRNKALNLRKKCIDTYKSYGIKGNNLAILSALTLGYKNKLDEKVRQAYSGAGAMHVLAVSGLHVGIIYLVLNILLSWFAIFARLKKAKYTLILFVLWGYAFLTGLSPSVMRATVMFSFVLFGQITNKKVSIYNSLAASAFFLLLINPLLLFELGFQLSYIAVIGIVFFHPRIYKLIYFRYKILNWMWSLTAVSIAAQLATFPITIYHFHQFPSYFWISNIGVTLSAFILMLFSILFFTALGLPAIATIIAIAINKILTLTYLFIQWVNNLPYSIISDISFSNLQVFLLYGLLFFIAIWLTSKRYAAIFTSLFCLFMLGFLTVFYTNSRNKQSAVCVYQVRSETAIQFVTQQKSVWLSSKQHDNPYINTLINNGNIYWKSTENSVFSINELTDTIIKHEDWYYNSGFWAHNKSKGLLIHTLSNIPKNPKDSIFLDYLFVSGNPSFSLKDLPYKIIYKNVIIDGSVPNWKIKQFTPKNPNANLYTTNNQGAFIAYNEL